VDANVVLRNGQWEAEFASDTLSNSPSYKSKQDKVIRKWGLDMG